MQVMRIRRRFIWAAYGVVLVIAGLGLRQMWLHHYDTNLLASRQRIGESMKRVESLIAASLSHVNMLRISAADALNDFGEGSVNVSPLYHHVVLAPGFGGYCSEPDRHVHERPAVSLSGLGSLPAQEEPIGREINMALLLNPQFAATAENIPNLAWAYYTSANRFLALYPAISCSDFHFTDDLLDHEFFKLGTPEVNPDHKPFWTQAYVDEAGKGLMATVGAPVYEGGRFLGTVAIDLTLQVLSQYVKNAEMDSGLSFIVNDKGQLLAHPTLVAPNDASAHRVEDAFGGDIADPMTVLAREAEDQFIEHGNLVIYSSSLSGAPWRYIHVSDRSALLWQALVDSRIEFAGFLLLVLLIAAFEKSRRIGFHLKRHVAELQETQLMLQAARDRAERAENAARQANRAKSVMLANASHDLRTPLNAIIGFSELALSQPFGPIGSAKYEEYLYDIHSSGNLLLAIVNDVLDLSKLEAGRYEMHEEAINVDTSLQMNSHLVSTQAERAGIELNLVVAPNLPLLWADRRAVQQIVLNLLSNAIKFTPRGGSVTVRAFMADDGRLAITFKDTGKGISAEDRALLFTPFSRGASANTANTQGTGLGLTIVKSLMELHGGTVAIDSAPGKGTTVSLAFPADRLKPLVNGIAA